MHAKLGPQCKTEYTTALKRLFTLGCLSLQYIVNYFFVLSSVISVVHYIYIFLYYVRSLTVSVLLALVRHFFSSSCLSFGDA